MSQSEIISIIIVLVSILFSLTLHEAMHAFTSNWLGDDTARLLGRVSLNPLKHIDPITTILLPILLYGAGLPPFGAAKPVPFNPYKVRFEEFGAALVGIAGPLTNLCLALVAGFWIRFVVGFEGPVFETVLIFMYVNLSFFVFNMIPYPPLDGSRLLYAFAPEPIQDFMKTIERSGFIGLMIFMLFGFQFVAPVVGNAVGSLATLILGVDIVF